MILIYDFGNFRRSPNAFSAFIWLKKIKATKIYFCSVVLEIGRGIRRFQSGSKFLQTVNCMKVVDRPILKPYEKLFFLSSVAVDVSCGWCTSSFTHYVKVHNSTGNAGR